MAQAILEQVSLKLSDRVGDSVTGLTVDGKVFTAQSRLDAINLARGRYFEQILQSMEPDQFAELYPEFTKETSTPITLSSGKGARPANCRYIIGCQLTRTGTVYIKEVKRIPKRVYYDAMNNTDSPFCPTLLDNKFFEKGEYVHIYAETGATVAGSINLIYMEQPIDLTLGGTDMPEPVTWRDYIIELAKVILLSNQQIV